MRAHDPAIRPHVSDVNWGAHLDVTDKGPRATLSNAVTVLQIDPDWIPDALHYDEFLHRVLVRDGTTLREWRDDDDTRLTVYLQQGVGMIGLGESVVASAVRYVARQRVRHCVRTYLESLTWDGTERLAHAFEDFWGITPAENQSSDYIRAVSANFFRGLVARVYQPGCQLDTMVVFEGEQGTRKSSALRTIGGPWYMAATESVSSKDFQQTLPGEWLVEIPELDAFSRSDRERVKSIISTPTDRYRPSYGRHAADHPRQCVFAGTTNRDDWGNDDTGLRRFWPVRCSGDILLDSLAAARDQLFAEALTTYRAQASWWEVPRDGAITAQADRQSEDVWTDLVLDYLLGKTDVAIHDVLADACKVPPAHMTHIHKLRIGSILRLAGWKKSNLRRSRKQGKRWVASDGE